MSVFGAYSRYYNLLYRDKDYAAESRYVRATIERYRSGPASILDLGCGTGRHDMLLAEMGYEVRGIDISAEMLEIARANASRDLPSGRAPRFQQGDIRTLRLGRRFDVVVSLFDVMSYQTTNQDLMQAFTTVHEHLEPGGTFIFDCWYGPAVLTDRPATRVKRLEDEEICVTRIAEPVLHPNENTVDVNYHVFVRDKTSGRVEEIHETHRTRYFFQPEIQMLTQGCKLKLSECRPFMRDGSAGFDTWKVVFVGTREI